MKCILCKGKIVLTPYKYEDKPLYHCEQCEEEYV